MKRDDTDHGAGAEVRTTAILRNSNGLFGRNITDVAIPAWRIATKVGFEPWDMVGAGDDGEDEGETP